MNIFVTTHNRHIVVISFFFSTFFIDKIVSNIQYTKYTKYTFNLISGKCSNVHLSLLRWAVLTVAHLHKGEGAQKTGFSEEGCGTAVLGTRLFSTLLCF